MPTVSTVPTDPNELFNTWLPAKITRDPALVRKVSGIYYFKIAGPGGADWTVDLVSSPPSCKPGKGVSPQVSVEGSKDDFATILKDMTQAMTLFFQGKLKVSGNAMLLPNLKDLLS